MQNKKDLISVIVPVYNVEKYIYQCIASILAQTYINLEIILIDDGSTDNSGKICDDYAKKDSRIKVIHKENGGLSLARNAGLKISKGKYIGFVDSDDYISKEMYEYLYNLITKDDADLAMCNMFIDKQGEWFVSKVITEPYKCVSQAEFFNFRSWRNVWNKLYRSSVLKDMRFDLNMSYGEDTAFLFEFITRSRKIAVGNKQAYYYRKNNSSLTHQFNKKHMRNLDIETKVMAYAKENDLPQLYKQALSSQMNAAGTWLKQLANQEKEDKESVREIIKFIRNNFTSFLFSSMKWPKKCFVLVALVNFNLAKKIYNTVVHVRSNK